MPFADEPHRVTIVDAQVRVAALSEDDIAAAMSRLGFRRRPEPWNRSERSGGVACAKLVFAPPAGARLSNVHVRLADGPNTRFALLFRDYRLAQAEIGLAG